MILPVGVESKNDIWLLNTALSIFSCSLKMGRKLLVFSIQVSKLCHLFDPFKNCIAHDSPLISPKTMRATTLRKWTSW